MLNICEDHLPPEELDIATINGSAAETNRATQRNGGHSCEKTGRASFDRSQKRPQEVDHRRLAKVR
jgi:hypothetical protein